MMHQRIINLRTKDNWKNGNLWHSEIIELLETPKVQIKIEFNKIFQEKNYKKEFAIINKFLPCHQ
jgi:hypothetical protein